MRTPVNTFNRQFSVSRVTNSHTLSIPFSRTLFICVLSIFNLSKGLSNIQFHLAELQTKSAGLFQMIPLLCFKNLNKVFLVQDCDKVSLVCTCCSYKTFCCHKHVCVRLCIDKTCVWDIFLTARLIRTLLTGFHSIY